MSKKDNQGNRDGLKTTLLTFLKDHSNSESEHRFSLVTLEEELYKNCEAYRDLNYSTLDKKERDQKKKNIRDSHLKTLRKNVYQLWCEHAVLIDGFDNTKNIPLREKIIYYNHPITSEKLPLLIEYILSMTNMATNPLQKNALIQDIISCAGKGLSDKYKFYLENHSPQYAALQRVIAASKRSSKVKRKYEGQYLSQASACEFIDLQGNINTIFQALSQEGNFHCKLSFHLIQYTKEGKQQLYDQGSLRVLTPYCINLSADRLWLIGCHDGSPKTYIYPIDRMKDIQILKDQPIKPTTESNPLWESTLSKYALEHQGGAFDDPIDIVLRVNKKEENAYTLIYQTFGNDFYPLKSSDSSYDRILVTRSPFFIKNWALLHLRDVIVETESVREQILEDLSKLNDAYSPT